MEGVSECIGTDWALRSVFLGKISLPDPTIFPSRTPLPSAATARHSGICEGALEARPKCLDRGSPDRPALFFFGAKLLPPPGRIELSAFRRVHHIPWPFTIPPGLLTLYPNPSTARRSSFDSTVAAMRRCHIPTFIAPHKQNPA